MLNINREVSGIFEEMTSQWDKSTIQISIKEIFMQKRKGVSSEEAYFTSLCQDIAFLTESSDPIKTVLEICFKGKSFYDTSRAESFIADSQNIIREEMSTLIHPYISNLRKDTLFESITVAEYSFAYARLRYDMEMDFLFAFLHPDNRAAMKPFLHGEPAEFFTAFDQVSDSYTNLFIHSFEDLFMYKKQEMKQEVREESELTKMKEVMKQEIIQEIKEEAIKEIAAANEKRKMGWFARLFGI